MFFTFLVFLKERRKEIKYTVKSSNVGNPIQLRYPHREGGKEKIDCMTEYFMFQKNKKFHKENNKIKIFPDSLAILRMVRLSGKNGQTVGKDSFFVVFFMKFFILCDFLKHEIFCHAIYFLFFPTSSMWVTEEAPKSRVGRRQTNIPSIASPFTHESYHQLRKPFPNLGSAIILDCFSL